MKGAYEAVIQYCSKYNNSGMPVPLTPQQRALYVQQQAKLGEEGLRGKIPYSAKYFHPKVHNYLFLILVH